MGKTSSHLQILDRPIWHSLNGRQANFVRGGSLAKGFLREVAAFIDCVDDSDEALSALGKLVPEDGFSYWLSADDRPVPPGVDVGKSALAVQMVAAIFEPVDQPADIIPLGPDDVAEMIALAELTEPGPFYSRTHELAQFWGVKRDGCLVAMAGERLKPGNYTEISGVCTHPDFRGNGYAASLSKWVTSLIVNRGEIPFLHSWADNDAAIRLYEALGYRHRADINVRLLRSV